MDTDIRAELDTVASWTWSFSFDDLCQFVDSSIDRNSLRRELERDERFVVLDSVAPNEPQFVSEKTLFQWYAHLNVRLALAKQFKLGETQLAFAMSQLRRDDRWQSPPLEFIAWGVSLGFIATSGVQGQYVFPLSRVLSYLSPESLDDAAVVLQFFSEHETWKLPLKQMAEKAMYNGFSQFDPKVGLVVKSREGLSSSQKLTLDQVGTSLGCTRERVRQIETRFWKNLYEGNSDYNRKLRRSFLTALLCDFMAEGGSFVLEHKSSSTPFRKFLAKCFNIPISEMADLDLSILTAAPSNVCKCARSFQPDIDAKLILNWLIFRGEFTMSLDDLQVLANALEQFHQRHLTQEHRVYLALRAIGQPAHYSTVAKVFNSLWPDRASTENNIHNVLNRERHGVVWIGVRGTFALEEWGYERPSKTLFETVVEIVSKRYAETGKPVPYTVIAAEIGKYRMIVKPTSLFIAAYSNPALERVSDNSFIPKGVKELEQDEISDAELDTLLRDFQAEMSQG